MYKAKCLNVRKYGFDVDIEAYLNTFTDLFVCLY